MKKDKSAVVFGIILIILGVFIFLITFGMIPIGALKDIFLAAPAVILIIIGLFIIFRNDSKIEHV